MRHHGRMLIGLAAAAVAVAGLNSFGFRDDGPRIPKRPKPDIERDPVRSRQVRRAQNRAQSKKGG